MYSFWYLEATLWPFHSSWGGWTLTSGHHSYDTYCSSEGQYTWSTDTGSTIESLMAYVLIKVGMPRQHSNKLKFTTWATFQCFTSVKRKSSIILAKRFLLLKFLLCINSLRNKNTYKVSLHDMWSGNNRWSVWNFSSWLLSVGSYAKKRKQTSCWILQTRHVEGKATTRCNICNIIF